MAEADISVQNISLTSDSQSVNSEAILQDKDSGGGSLTFFSQIIIISTVILAAIINLSLPDTRHTEIWIALLSTCIGFVVPGPRLKKYKNKKIIHEKPLNP